jgi:hypothetical protein
VALPVEGVLNPNGCVLNPNGRVRNPNGCFLAVEALLFGMPILRKELR